MDLLTKVASALDACNAPAAVFRKMSPATTAQLLVTVFEHLRDDTVDSILLEGNEDSVWLATTLLWLLDGISSLLTNDQQVQGDPHAKCCMRITTDCDVSWKLQVWRGSASVLSFVYDVQDDES